MAAILRRIDIIVEMTPKAAEDSDLTNNKIADTDAINIAIAPKIKDVITKLFSLFFITDPQLSIGPQLIPMQDEMYSPLKYVQLPWVQSDDKQGNILVFEI